MSHEAIITTYKGPTDTRGALITVKWGSSRMSVPYPHQLSGVECHRFAAEQLRNRVAQNSEDPKGNAFTLPLEHGFISGSNQYVFVLNPAARHLARVLVSRCEKGQQGNPYTYRAIREARAHFSEAGNWQDDNYKNFTGYERDAEGMSVLPEGN